MMNQNDIVYFMEQKPIHVFLQADHTLEFRATALSFIMAI